MTPQHHEIGLDSTPPVRNCADCGRPHAGWWIRCDKCEEQYQREQSVFRRYA